MNGTTRTRALAFSSAISLSTALATPAWAQPAANPPATQATSEATTNDEIVVTARRKEELLQDVPISITVFNQQQLNNRNVTNAQDLANYTPSLSVTTGFGSENSTFALRGFVQETGTAPSVGVYFADVVAPRGPSQGFPAGDGAGPGMFFDLQNVQVLKGPQGTLFGRNTTGGAVLLVPNKPTDHLSGYAELSIGNYNMRRVQGVLNLPLTDAIRLRVGADVQQRDGFMKNVVNIGPQRFDDIDYQALRASLVIELTPDIETYTIASFVHSENNGHVAKLVACDPNGFFNSPLFFRGGACANIAAQNAQGFYTVNADMPDAYQKMQTWQVINNTKFQVNDNLVIRNIISYAQLWTKTHTSLFGTHFVVAQGSLGFLSPFLTGLPTTDVPWAFASIRHLPGGYSSNQATFTEELRAEGSGLGGRLTYQGGLYYEKASPRGFIGSQSPTFIGCSDPDGLRCTNAFPIPTLPGINFTAAKNWFQSKGVYAQATYSLTDQFKLTGGFRYTWDKVRSVSRRITYVFPSFVPNSPPILPVQPFNPANPAAIATVSRCTDFTVRTPPLCELDESKKFDAPTWLIGLDYNPTDDILLYAKYTRGYRTGNIKSDVPIEFHIFEPEKVNTYEIGAKTEFKGALRGHFNISAFYNDFTNQQIQLGFTANLNRNPPISVPGNAGPVNVGKSRIWGIEIDAGLRPFRGFTLDAAYTYLNTKVKEVVDVTLPPDNVYVVSAAIRAGDPLILSPKHKFTVTGTYTLPLDESIGKVSVGATYTYISSQISNYTALRNPTIITRTGFNTSRLAPRSLVNANLNWETIGGTPLDLSLFVTNLTKKKYYTGINGLITGLGFETATVGEPRMYGARLRIRLGE
jgi:iron complex outermembrane receptor protein